MGGASGDGHAATPAWDYEVVTIVVVIGTSLLAFGLESVHHHSHRHTVASRMVEHVQTEFSLLGLVAILLYYVEDMLLLRNIPDEFLLDQFPAHYGEFDTSWWWPVMKIPQKLAEDYTGANALAGGLAHYHAAHAPSRALLRAIVKGGVMTRPRR